MYNLFYIYDNKSYGNPPVWTVVILWIIYKINLLFPSNEAIHLISREKDVHVCTCVCTYVYPHPHLHTHTYGSH